METEGAVIVRVNTVEVEDLPVGKPVMVMVYVPGGTMDVVEIVRIELAPVNEGVTVVGENVMVPHALGPELDWHTEGIGETESVRVTSWAVPLVRVAVTGAVMDDPTATDPLVGLTDTV